MRFLRSSIAEWLLAVLVAGIGLAALRRNEDGWSLAFAVLTAGLFVLAILGAVVGRGRGRVACAAFAILGGGYWCLATAMSLGPRLPTTRLLDAVGPRLCPLRMQRVELPRSDFDHAFSAWAAAHRKAATITFAGHVGPSATIELNWVDLDFEPFRRAGHCLFALVLAWLGSAIARALAPNRARATRADWAEEPIRRTG